MNLRMKIFACVVAVLFAATISISLGPTVAEAAGPYFSSIYVSNKSINAGYSTVGTYLTVGTYETVGDSLRVGKRATFNGDLSLGSVTCDTNSFLAKATTDTTTVTGASLTDKYLISWRQLGAWDSLGTIMIQPTATGFVAHRDSAAARLEANAKYTWLRIK